MDVYMAKNKYDGNLYKLKFFVRGDLHNRDLVGYTWSQTASISTLKYLLSDATKYKTRFYQLDFIGLFLKVKVKNRVFVKLDSGYADYFP